GQTSSVLTVRIDPSDANTKTLLANPGTLSIDVFEPSAASTVSKNFTVDPFDIGDLTPESINAGETLPKLQVSAGVGTSFTSNMVILWNGNAIPNPTVWKNSTLLEVNIPANFVNSLPGDVETDIPITVVDAGAGHTGATTLPFNFKVMPQNSPI